MAKIGIDFLKLNNTQYIFITYMHQTQKWFFFQKTIFYTYMS